MGRARRNQREAIRKQRAKKRRRKDPSTCGSDSEDDSGLVLATAVEQPSTAEQSSTNDNAKGPSCNSDSKPSADAKLRPADESEANPPATASDSAVSPTPAAAPKKPVDRIERMRLKKQQQKARRKEKKAAREAAASASKR
ncbi:hypothetical protein ACHAXT_003920 [Thalassiosira profunda]